MKNDLLSVQEAASIVGVSSSTLKRMCESESIPFSRTPGGHRRIDRLDLERVSNRYTRTRKTGHAEHNPDTGLSIEHVVELLLESNPLEVARLFSRSASTPLELVATLEDWLITALWKIGEMWRENKIDVYQEHLCTNTAQTSIDILRQHVELNLQGAKVAIGGTFAPCIETLPSKLVALCLELAGMKSVDLGGYLPAESLAKAAKDYQATLVWVTHTHVSNVDALLASHLVLKESLPPDTRVIIGGGGMSPAIRRSLPWCEFYETLSQLFKSESIRTKAKCG
jgi:excisionase family DNA binding protein